LRNDTFSRRPAVRRRVRLVSLVPSWTETLYSFGLDQAVVGVTRWCVHPKELVARVPKVGGTKDPDVDAIVALRPDLVVCEHEENRREDVEAMRARGLDVWLSDVRSLDDSLRWTLSLGEAVGRADAALALTQRIAASRRDVAEAAPRERVPVFVPIWRRPWMTLTRDTYAHHVLALAGAENVFADGAAGDGSRYPEAAPEQALAAGATAALLPTEPYPFHDKLDAATEELVAAGFARERIRVVDGEALTWYGAREVEGLRVVAEAVRRLTGDGKEVDGRR
jgi:ABC-type Fe3+-hydroxamate transport system substrate-binding protein